MAYYYSSTRYKRKIDKEAKKQVFFLIISIIILVILLFKFGLSVTKGIAGLFIKLNEVTSSQNQQSQQKNDILIPPVLDPIPNATNSAEFTIKGKSSTKDKVKVQLYLNQEIKTEISPDKEGKFAFENIELKDGENLIKVRLETNENNYSQFSNEYIIYFAKKDPNLEISFPSDNSTFSRGDQQINIKGKTDSNNKVLVNGFQSLMQAGGSFSYFLNLSEGDNIIKIEAIDLAGNTTTKEIKVTYSP